MGKFSVHPSDASLRIFFCSFLPHALRSSYRTHFEAPQWVTSDDSVLSWLSVVIHFIFRWRRAGGENRLSKKNETEDNSLFDWGQRRSYFRVRRPLKYFQQLVNEIFFVRFSSFAKQLRKDLSIVNWLRTLFSSYSAYWVRVRQYKELYSHIWLV